MTLDEGPGRADLVASAASAHDPIPVAPPGRGRPATASERRERIARMLELSGSVSVTELVERFGVTDVSIRRDLDLLEDAGRLRRVHGGATSVGRATSIAATGTVPGSIARRRRGSARGPHRWSPRATSSCSTPGRPSPRWPPESRGPLRRSGAITVVTNSLPVIDEVGRWDSPHLICLGGLYLPEYQATVGPQAVTAMEDLSGTVAFIGCDGLTAATGLTTPHVLVAQMGATMTTRASRVIAVTDGSKIGRRGLTPIAPLDAIDVLVTDASADPDELEFARELGIEVILV